MQHGRLAQTHIDNPYLPGIFPLSPWFEALIRTGRQPVNPIIDNHHFFIMLIGAVVETKLMPHRMADPPDWIIEDWRCCESAQRNDGIMECWNIGFNGMKSDPMIMARIRI